MLLSKCVVCNSKISKFSNEQEVSGLLSSLGTKKPLSKITFLGPLHWSFIDNIWGADLADMQLISKFKEGFRFLLCFIDIYSKYVWVIPLKNKKRH